MTVFVLSVALRHKNKKNIKMPENPVSEPTVQGNQQEHAPDNHQHVSAHQRGERAAANALVTQPSSKKDQWHNEQKVYWERQIRISTWLNLITVGGTVIAIGALYVLNSQINMMQTSLHTSERAWVMARGPKLQSNLAVGEVPTVYVRVQNSGKSPALKVRVSHTTDMITKLPNGHMPKPLVTGQMSETSIAPDEYHRSIVPLGGPMTQDYLVHLGQGNLSIVSYGTITYLDIFDIKHHTDFCLILRDIKGTDLSPCGQWNEAD